MTNQAELYANVSTGQFQCGLELIDMASPKTSVGIMDHWNHLLHRVRACLILRSQIMSFIG